MGSGELKYINFGLLSCGYVISLGIIGSPGEAKQVSIMQAAVSFVMATLECYPMGIKYPLMMKEICLRDIGYKFGRLWR